MIGKVLSASDEIINRIEKDGPITFAEFMDMALYLPGAGYYTSGKERWGRAGDYITNCDVSSVFSRMLGKQIHQMWRLLGSPEPFLLVEAGGGRGLLTEGILTAIDELYPEFHGCLRAKVAEKGRTLGRPAGGRQGGRIEWCGEVSEIAGPFTGCIYSQELLDSLPFHRVVGRGGRLKEIYVGYEGGRFFDVEGEPSTEELPGYFRDLGIALEDGQVCEAGLKAKGWITEAGRLLERGFIITVDYGLPARSLYAAGRRGTLLCHCRHTTNDDPYRMVGMQDITCHVDFTTARNAGAGSGLNPTGFALQRDFLIGMGILEELKEAHNPTVEDCGKIIFNQGIKELIMPGGIGDTMKVFIQHKGVEDPNLRGFSFRDMKGCL